MTVFTFSTDPCSDVESGCSDLLALEESTTSEGSSWFQCLWHRRLSIRQRGLMNYQQFSNPQFCASSSALNGSEDQDITSGGYDRPGPSSQSVCGSSRPSHQGVMVQQQPHALQDAGQQMGLLGKLHRVRFADADHPQGRSSSQQLQESEPGHGHSSSSRTPRESLVGHDPVRGAGPNRDRQGCGGGAHEDPPQGVPTPVASSDLEDRDCQTGNEGNSSWFDKFRFRQQRRAQPNSLSSAKVNLKLVQDFRSSARCRVRSAEAPDPRRGQTSPELGISTSRSADPDRSGGCGADASQ